MKPLVSAITIGIALAYPVFSYTTVDYIEGAVVTNKERISESDGTSRYLVWTENETFKVEDSWLFLRFRSSDDYGRIANGSVCNLKVNGWRVGFFSAYRNILEADCSAPSN